MCIELALYNKWQNEVLYQACDGLTKEELGRRQGAFFGSLLGTLNHIYHVDRELLDYIDRGTPPRNFDPTVERYGEFPDLKQARSRLDNQILAMMQSSSESWLDEIFEYHSDDRGGMRNRPRALFIVQMFNHQTHHRSQATSLFHSMGIAYGSTDLPANPYSQS